MDWLGGHFRKPEAHLERGFPVREVNAGIERKVVESTQDLPAAGSGEYHLTGGVGFGLDETGGNSKVLEHGSQVGGEAARELAFPRWKKNGQKRPLAQAQDETRMAHVQEVGIPVTKETG